MQQILSINRIIACFVDTGISVQFKQVMLWSKVSYPNNVFPDLAINKMSEIQDTNQERIWVPSLGGGRNQGDENCSFQYINYYQGANSSEVLPHCVSLSFATVPHILALRPASNQHMLKVSL